MYCTKCKSKIIEGRKFCPGCGILINESNVTDANPNQSESDALVQAGMSENFSYDQFDTMPTYEPIEVHTENYKKKKSPFLTLIFVALILGIAAFLVFYVFRPFAPYRKSLNTFFDSMEVMDLNSMMEAAYPKDYLNAIGYYDNEIFTQAAELLKKNFPSDFKIIYKLGKVTNMDVSEFNEKYAWMVNTFPSSVDKVKKVELKLSASMEGNTKINKSTQKMNMIMYEMGDTWYALPEVSDVQQGTLDILNKFLK